MKKINLPIAIIISSIIISFAIYYAVTNEKRVEMKNCLNAHYYQHISGDRKPAVDYKGLKKEAKKLCKIIVYDYTK